MRRTKLLTVIALGIAMWPLHLRAMVTPQGAYVPPEQCFRHADPSPFGEWWEWQGMAYWSEGECLAAKKDADADPHRYCDEFRTGVLHLPMCVTLPDGPNPKWMWL